jgi:hypothetical protein
MCRCKPGQQLEHAPRLQACTLLNIPYWILLLNPRRSQRMIPRSQASATSLQAKKKLSSNAGVIGVDRDYIRWLAVYKRKPLVGDDGPAPAGSLKMPDRPGASTVCKAATTEPSSTEVTPWGIKLIQADDPFLRSIAVSSSILFCVIDSGRCWCCCRFTQMPLHAILGMLTP